ncbi:trans-4-hydroxy-L-proline dehydratase activase [Hathewaya histolytica]|uniref:Glycyl-radical enzyme activating family protein n=1 Tax=Hathewaya histolytica TaxID=1498 RepID=A0A4V6KEF0_HATHI|nr:trans-4-hydroxy-L-proline dehydratase activase [Hathewaya histolytica]VTQ94577.1 glycyl-radical enzyme activating family protein [Hathewaya histolytica]
MEKGIVFNIQKYSVHDGPGIRTTVFLKGCPLNCWWCHNPESQKLREQLMYFDNKCVACGSCVKWCKEEALSLNDGKISIDESKCTLCGRCTDVCLKGALEIAGKEVDINELMKEIKKDEIFYDQSKGGVTFSGGEPLVQIDFLESMLKACKEAEIHTTVDTCAHASWDSFERIIDYTDLFLVDLKHINSSEHKKYTGVGNELILENIKKLSELRKNLFIRIPIMPGINDSKETLEDTVKFLKNINMIQVNLLPYHRIGMDKYRRLNKDYKLKDLKEPTKKQMMEISEYFKDSGFNVKIGG